MKTPYISEKNNSRGMTQTFLGLDRRERVADGAWSEMQNLSVDGYPVAGTRDKRIRIMPKTSAGEAFNDGLLPSKPKGVCSVDNILYFVCEGGMLYTGEKQYPLSGEAHSIVPFGRGVFTSDGTFLPYAEQDGGRTPVPVMIEANIPEFGAEITLADMSFEQIDYVSSDKEPRDPQDGFYWYDQSAKGLYKYSGTKGEWVPVATSYIRIDTEHFLPGFREGDAVEVHSEPAGGPEGAYVISKIHEPTETGQDTNWTMWLDGLCEPQSGKIYTVSIRRRAPVFDFIASWNNRVWGCRYGENDKGEFVNEVYGSALGDALNFFRYEGTAADSYTASVGTGGEWTGIAASEDNVYFFKEDRVYILSGSEPSNFRLHEMWGPGVKKGSAKSVVAMNNYVYYRSADGFMRLSGYNYPALISHALTRMPEGNAVGGRDGERIVWMMDADGGHETLVYDTAKGLWAAEDIIGEDPLALIRHAGMLMFLTEGHGGAYGTYLFRVDHEKMNDRFNKAFEYGLNALQGKDYFEVCWAGSNYLTRHRGSSLINDFAEDVFYEIIEPNLSKLPAIYGQKAENLESPADIGMYFITNDAWASPELLVPYNFDAAYLRGPETSDMTEGFPTESFAGNPVTVCWEATPESEFDWYGVTGIRGLGDPDVKRVNCIKLRLKCDAGTRLKVSIMYDEDGTWEKILDEQRRKTGTFVMKLFPQRRCDLYRLKIEGNGQTVIYSITEELEDAGDSAVGV